METSNLEEQFRKLKKPETDLGLRLIDRGEIALLEWDMEGEKVNKFNFPMMYRMRDIAEELKKSSYKAVIAISRKPNIFIAGADIDEIKNLKTKEEFSFGVEGGQYVMNLIEDLPMPVIAAIHGACVGGGCEFALACDYRMATDDRSTKIGLPEVQLGIIPGFGGCVRLPRVVGLANSLDIILAGKTPPAKKALKIGLIDKLVHPASLETEAMKWAQEIIAKGAKKRKKTFKPRNMMDRFVESFVGRRVAYSQAEKGVLSKTHGHYPGPLKALEVVKATYGSKNRESAMKAEREGFCEMAITDVSKHLISLFYMMEDIKKQSGVADLSVEPREVSHLGVLGAGTMGGGIAYVAADKGVDVRMKDLAPEALSRGFEAASALWQKKLKRKRLDKFEYQRKMNLVSGGLDYSGFKKMDLVVEAIVEDMGIKQKVIGETAGHCADDCIIATNTSSLSVNEMAQGHPRPEYFAGMHFFNPVDKMPLVEVIRGEKTNDQTVATVFNLARRMGKMPVVVKDGPGFLVNRLLFPYMTEAAFLLVDGMAVDTVDKIFVKTFGMPMGPYTLMDEVGLDVCGKVAKVFQKAFGARAEVAPVMDKVDADPGRLGKKTKKGFYLYDDKGKQLQLDSQIYQLVGLNEPKNPLSEKVCIERCVFPMINEAAQVLFEEKIVERPQDVDMGMIMGTGFPPFRGGLLRYADSLGSKYICEQLDSYAAEYGERLRPNSILREMAQSDRKFYS